MNALYQQTRSMSNARMTTLDALAAERDALIARINREGRFSRAEELCFHDAYGNILQCAMRCAIDGETYTVAHDKARDEWFTVDSPRTIAASVMIEAVAARVASNRAQRISKGVSN